MNKALSFILGLAVALPGTFQKANATPQSHKRESHLVHFVVINMSGKAREVRHRGNTVTLPIAVDVPLQVPAGDGIEVTSNTNNKVEDVIEITAANEGHVIPIE